MLYGDMKKFSSMNLKNIDGFYTNPIEINGLSAKFLDDRPGFQIE